MTFYFSLKTVLYPILAIFQKTDYPRNIFSAENDDEKKLHKNCFFTYFPNLWNIWNGSNKGGRHIITRANRHSI